MKTNALFSFLLTFLVCTFSLTDANTTSDLSTAKNSDESGIVGVVGSNIHLRKHMVMAETSRALKKTKGPKKTKEPKSTKGPKKTKEDQGT